jgi:hypothetical protein
MRRNGLTATIIVAVTAEGIDCETARRVLSDQTGGSEAECTRGSARVSYGPPRTKNSWRSCANVSFAPNSGDLASNIRALRVSCTTARSIVRKVRRGQNRPNGFRCTKTTDTSGVMPVTDRTCRRGKARIRWTT